MPRSSLHYTRAAVIVHGKCELQIVKYIKTNLKLPIQIIADKNGAKSIQINSLLKYLDKTQFKSMKSFADFYRVEYQKEKKRLNRFHLFIIMDTDDCDANTLEQYKNGTLFNKHFLAPYIIPIYNTENLEDVLSKTSIMPKRIRDREKGTFYEKVFPINVEGKTNPDTINQIKFLADELRKVKTTNMEVFIDYCLKEML